MGGGAGDDRLAASDVADGYLGDVAYGGAGNDMILADNGGQVTGVAGTDDCAGNTVQSVRDRLTMVR